VLGQSCCVFVPVLSLLCYLRIITFVVHINYFQSANSRTVLLLSYISITEEPSRCYSRPSRDMLSRSPQSH